MTEGLDPDEAPTWISDILSYGHIKNVVAGPDEDDCGIIEFNGHVLVLTTDYLNANPIALELGIGDYYDLGRLVVDSNLSDLCGTGARPMALLLAITLNKSSSDKSLLRDLVRGAKAEADKYGVPIIGGDTKLGDSDALLCAALGSSPDRSNLFLKKCAEPGDIIWASGQMGSVCAALIGLTNGLGDEEWREWAKKAVINPELPMDKSKLIHDSSIGKGGIDISDGLGDDIKELCRTSGVGANIYVDKVPISENSKTLSNNIDYPFWTFPFVMGGDMQFIVTTENDENSVRVSHKIGLYEIGKVIQDENVYLKQGEKKWEMPSTGHRDARGVSFSDEVVMLIEELVSS